MFLNGVSQVHTTAPSLLTTISETSCQIRAKFRNGWSTSLNTFCGHSRGVKHQATLPTDAACPSRASSISKEWGGKR